MILLGKETDWESASIEIAKPNFIEDITNFNRENQNEELIMEQLKPYTNDPSLNPNQLHEQSPAIATLCNWVLAINEYLWRLKQIMPQLLSHEENKKDQEKAIIEREALQQKADRLNDEIRDLEADLQKRPETPYIFQEEDEE